MENFFDEKTLKLKPEFYEASVWLVISRAFTSMLDWYCFVFTMLLYYYLNFMKGVLNFILDITEPVQGSETSGGPGSGGPGSGGLEDQEVHAALESKKQALLDKTSLFQEKEVKERETYGAETISNAVTVGIGQQEDLEAGGEQQKDPEDGDVQQKDPEDGDVQPKDPEDGDVQQEDPEDGDVQQKDPEDGGVQPKDPEDGGEQKEPSKDAMQEFKATRKSAATKSLKDQKEVTKQTPKKDERTRDLRPRPQKVESVRTPIKALKTKTPTIPESKDDPGTSVALDTEKSEKDSSKESPEDPISDRLRKGKSGQKAEELPRTLSKITRKKVQQQTAPGTQESAASDPSENIVPEIDNSRASTSETGNLPEESTSSPQEKEDKIVTRLRSRDEAKTPKK